MGRTSALVVVAAFLLAGCLARGEDPFAYTRKPLYSGHFDLAEVAMSGDAQEFRVTDGSIAKIRVQVWVNATRGGALVRVLDSGGRLAMETETTTMDELPNDLGVWRVEVEGRLGPDGGAEGSVALLVTRR